MASPDSVRGSVVATTDRHEIIVATSPWQSSETAILDSHANHVTINWRIIQGIPRQHQTSLKTMVVNHFDRDALRERVRSSKPVPNFCIDNFLDVDFANRVLEAFPSYEDGTKLGTIYNKMNEKGKIQVSDSSKFAGPIAELNQALAAPEFLETMSYVFDIPDLLADHELVGGGIHQTGPRGHLDVHLDFNYIRDRQLHRRLNILIYFNKDWKPEWGGNFELWDEAVKVCHHSFSPIFNRCLVFATNEVSYHGVTAVKCPENQSRKSFAAYYYTKEAPAGWDGTEHDTIFKARPNEIVKGKLLMPLRDARQKLRKMVAGFTAKKSK